jgi:protein-L-isoaspartate(D-aspartate) O-methyltransferase
VNEPDSDKYRKDRDEMVTQQIARRGIRNERVLEAMRKVPRERFVRDSDRNLAFYDGPLSIGCGQTISQPYIVAYMTDMLELGAGDRVLEIGTGSGYQTAVLAEIASEVYTVEIVEQLGSRARAILEELGYSNIRYRIGDGYDGWAEEAPFDAIIVTAAPPKLPDRLVAQLADGGRISVPVGRYDQLLVRITRRGEEIEEETMLPVRFVPMTGGKEHDL